MTLSSAVNRLNSKYAKDLAYSHYKVTTDQNLSSDFKVWDFTNTGDMTLVFGVDPGAGASFNRVDLDVQVTIANEPSEITYSFFLVSLREETASQLMSNLSEQLTGMTENIHYTKGPPNHGGWGQVFLNPSFFITHRSSRFQLSGLKYDDGAGSEARNQIGTVKRLHYSIPWRKRLVSGRGVWDGTVSTVPFTARLWLLMFNDNSAADAQYPHVTGNGLWSISSH